MALCRVFNRLRALSSMQNVVCIPSGSRLANGTKEFNVLARNEKFVLSTRKLSLSTDVNSKSDEPNLEKFPQPQKKKKVGARITLISTDESVTVVSLDEAGKIARRRDLKLVKIVDFDSKAQRPVYRLMTGSEYFEEDLRRRAEKKAARNEAALKGEKMVTLMDRISEHDLSSKIKNINKWLEKKYEVRFAIHGNEKTEEAEKIFARIESETKASGKLVQKRIKGTDIKFQIVPLKKEKNPNSSDNEQPPDATEIEPVLG